MNSITFLLSSNAVLTAIAVTIVALKQISNYTSFATVMVALLNFVFLLLVFLVELSIIFFKVWKIFILLLWRLFTLFYLISSIICTITAVVRCIARVLLLLPRRDILIWILLYCRTRWLSIFTRSVIFIQLLLAWRRWCEVTSHLILRLLRLLRRHYRR